MPNSQVILGLQGTGQLLSYGQRDRAASGVTWKRCLGPYRSSSGVGVSGEIGQVPPGRHVCVSASTYQGQGWGQSVFSRLSPEASSKQPWHTSSFPRTPPTCPATYPAKGLHLPHRPSLPVLQQPILGTCSKPFLWSSPLDNITPSLSQSLHCASSSRQLSLTASARLPLPLPELWQHRLKRPVSHLPWGALPCARKLKVASGWDLGVTPSSCVVLGKILHSRAFVSSSADEECVHLAGPSATTESIVLRAAHTFFQT